jgi:hypothetical protein
MEANGEATRGTTPKVGRTTSASGGWTTTKVAAKALGVSPRTVQSYIRRGLLNGRAEGEGVKRAWLVSADSINALRAERLAQDSGGGFRGSPAELFVQSIGEAMQNLSARVVEEATRAASLEARLQLTERAESTLREQLELERERADKAERRAEALEATLLPPPQPREAPQTPAQGPEVSEPRPAAGEPREEAERRSSWWRRIFEG